MSLSPDVDRLSDPQRALDATDEPADERDAAAADALRAEGSVQSHLMAAMADLQKIYVEKAVEVPLYYRKQVDLHAPRLNNFFANPTQAGPTWNVADWFVTD